MATIRERKPGVWEVCGFTGRGATGGRRKRLGPSEERNVMLTVSRRSSSSARPRQRGKSRWELLDLWIEQNEQSWTPYTSQNQRSRVALVKPDPVAKIPAARLTAVDVDR